MEHSYKGTRIALVRGDVTEQSVDAIVNAANAQLAPGGGVCGAIHSAGGRAIAAECRRYVAEHGEVPTGGAVVTGAGDLPAKWVVHAVGPRWQDGQRGENVDLERAYINALSVASKAGARSVAFPSISTGIYGFPLEPAAMIAVGSILRFVRGNEGAVDEVRMVLFSDEDHATYERVFAEVVRTHLES